MLLWENRLLGLLVYKLCRAARVCILVADACGFGSQLAGLAGWQSPLL